MKFVIFSLFVLYFIDYFSLKGNASCDNLRFYFAIDSIPEKRDTVNPLPVASCVPLAAAGSNHAAYHFNIFETSKTFEYEIRFSRLDSLLTIPDFATPPYQSQGSSIFPQMKTILTVADKTQIPVIEVVEKENNSCIAGYRNAAGEFIASYQLQLINNGNSINYTMEKLK